MKPNEKMAVFCGRARALQEAVGVEHCSDQDLAWAVVGGSTPFFRSVIEKDHVMRQSINPVSGCFSFAAFKQLACESWTFALQIEAKTSRGPQAGTMPSSNAPTAPSRAPAAPCPQLTADEVTARNAQ